MNVHILFESSDHTNGRIVGVWTDRKLAEQGWFNTVDRVSSQLGDLIPETHESPDCWSYFPDDTEEHKGVSVMLFLDVEVTS